MANSSRRSSGPVLSIASTFQPSISQSRGFYIFSSLELSSFASSTSSTSSSKSSDLSRRSTSPTRVHLHGFTPFSPSKSVSISMDRPVTPQHSMAADQVLRKKNGQPFTNLPKKTCMCSPTTHTGSFRCSLHKNCNNTQSVSYSPNKLDALRSAMKNSLVRIGTVEGDWVKRALAALIRPSSHQQRRRASFQPRPSRLSMMSKADGL